MGLLGFKNRTIGWLMLYVCIGFLPLAFSGRLIQPFPFTPTAAIESYNYVSGIVANAQPIILLYLIFTVLLYLQRVNLDRRTNNWIKKSTQDVLRVVVALLIYRIKELADYLVFENVMPDCLNPFWFLIIWEVAPVVLLMAWAVISAKRQTECPEEV